MRINGIDVSVLLSQGHVESRIHSRPAHQGGEDKEGEPVVIADGEGVAADRAPRMFHRPFHNELPWLVGGKPSPPSVGKPGRNDIEVFPCYRTQASRE